MSSWLGISISFQGILFYFSYHFLSFLFFTKPHLFRTTRGGFTSKIVLLYLYVFKIIYWLQLFPTHQLVYPQRVGAVTWPSFLTADLNVSLIGFAKTKLCISPVYNYTLEKFHNLAISHNLWRLCRFTGRSHVRIFSWTRVCVYLCLTWTFLCIFHPQPSWSSCRQK